jgi:deoxyadenosine/deoxycytidine kinase
MVYIISINGNIACGKSTLLKALKEKGHNVVLEGYDRGKWGDVLNMYYKNPKPYGYLFQTVVIAEMKETYESIREESKFIGTSSDDIVFVERAHVDCLAFAQLVHANGHMTNTEYETFKKLYDSLLEQPDCIITLNLEAEVCFERCKARARACESGITLEYLKGVQRSTEKAMLTNSMQVNAPTLMSVNVLGMSTDEIVNEIEDLVEL